MGMLRNDARHKKQFGAQGGACLVIGGSARLAKMVRVCGAAAGPMLWQGRAAGQGIDLVVDPLNAGAVAKAAIAAASVSACAAMQGGLFDTVVCFAGVIRGDAAALALNTDLAIAALETAREIGARRVILSSSAAVYGAQSGLLGEDRALMPAAPYGAAKAQMEGAAQAWRDAHAPEVEVCALRIGNVAGADALLGGAGSGSGQGEPSRELTLDLFADGHGPRRSYIGPQCFARAVLAAIAAPDLPPALNIALPGLVSMDGLLRAAGRPFVGRPAGAGAIASVELDCGLAAGLGIVPQGPAQADDIIADLRGYEALK